tara:strand:- start:9047 stop:9226 length:180 start_codon:yes stop_codon:yes gene_type:complete
MNEEVAPSKTLAILTVDSLIKSGLLRAEKRDDLVAKVAEGNMKSEDWKLEIDLASTKDK